MDEYCRTNAEISPPILDIDDEEPTRRPWNPMYFIRKMCRGIKRFICISV